MHTFGNIFYLKKLFSYFFNSSIESLLCNGFYYQIIYYFWTVRHCITHCGLPFGRDSYNEIRVMMIYLHEMVWHSICQNNLNLYQRNLFRWITPMLDAKWGKYTSCFSQILDVLFPLFIPWNGLRKFLHWPIEEHP